MYPNSPGPLPVRPWLRRDAVLLWCAEGLLQMGAPPGESLRWTGVSSEVVAWLRGLDGSRGLHQVLADVPSELDTTGALQALTALARLGALDDAAAFPHSLQLSTAAERARLRPEQALAAIVAADPAAGAAALDRRAAAGIRILGSGRVGGALAMVLAAAGVGAVEVQPRHDATAVRPTDIGALGPGPMAVGSEPRAAIAAELHRQAPGTAHRVPAPDLVVITDNTDAQPLLSADIPHLPVVVRGAAARIGPLVLPGRTSCLCCGDLTARDLDPWWPRLAVQLAQRRPADPDSALAVAVAALTGLQILAWLDRPDRLTGSAAALPLVNGVLELFHPEGTVQRRAHPVHPLCGCGWRWAGPRSGDVEAVGGTGAGA